MAQSWFYVVDSQQRGPIDAAELQQMLAMRALPPDTLVWSEGMSQWLPASQIPELTASGSPQSASPVPPPPVAYSNGQPVPYAGGPAGEIPNYLVQAILVTVFCCMPFGVVAIVFAAQVNPKLAGGDYVGAKDASDKARNWSWISFGTGLLAVVFYMFAAVMQLVTSR